MPKAKKVTKENYTDVQVSRLLEVYDPKASQADRDAQVKALANEFDKPLSSIRAKLSREGVYVSKTKTSKVTGETPATKEKMVETLAGLVGCASEKLETVAKANKLAIQEIIDGFIEALAQADANRVDTSAEDSETIKTAD